MSDGIPSAVQIVNELKAYMELKDKQVITAEQLKNAKILCKEMATMCLNVQVGHWNQMMDKMNAAKAEVAKVEEKKDAA